MTFFRSRLPLVQPGVSIPTGAAATLLFQPRPLEPDATIRTDGIYHGGHLTSGEPHLTGSTSTLTANRDQDPGGDPGADRSGGQTKALDDLRDIDQDVYICARIHGATLSQRERQCQTLFAM